MTGKTLIEVKQLIKWFPVHTSFGSFFEKKNVHALDSVDLDIQEGETLGLVGESGCGKTTVGRCILKLIEATSGKIIFKGNDITLLSRQEMRSLRRNMQIVFQDPFSSLDPRKRVRDIIGQPFKVFRPDEGENRKDRIRYLIEAVGLETDVLDRYPHEFSGGQRQRIAIARALALNPQFIVADEPVSSLDVSIRAQILNLMKFLKNKFKLTYLFISHDLSTVKFISDRIAVMYLGKVVEMGPASRIFACPKHPYTRALIDMVPIPNPELRKERRLIQGELPSSISPPEGCRFHPRCPQAMDICNRTEPKVMHDEFGHQVRCYLYEA